jgi:hypothetical protein
LGILAGRIFVDRHRVSIDGTDPGTNGAVMLRGLIVWSLFMVVQLVAQVPYWATSTPQAVDHLYSVGVESLGRDEAKARARAAQNARLELLLQLRTRATGQVSLQSKAYSTWSEALPATHDSVRAFGTRMQLDTHAMALHGLEIREVVVDQLGRQVFALAILDLRRARNDYRSSGRRLQEQIAACIASPVPCSLDEGLQRLKELHQLEARLSAWEDTEVLLAEPNRGIAANGPSQTQIRVLRSMVPLSLSLVETLDLPSGLVSGLHEWRSSRRLLGSSGLVLRLSPRAILEWATVMDLDRVRACWTLSLSTPDGDRLAVWTFEDQAVGATRSEALRRVTGMLLPRAQEALDRWFGFLPPTPSSMEAS